MSERVVQPLTILIATFVLVLLCSATPNPSLGTVVFRYRNQNILPRSDRFRSDRDREGPLRSEPWGTGQRHQCDSSDVVRSEPGAGAGQLGVHRLSHGHGVAPKLKPSSKRSVRLDDFHRIGHRNYQVESDRT